MNITLINPNNVTQKGDFFGTGIPYMPIMLASLAATLREKHTITIIDAFGEKPWQKHVKGNLIIQGLRIYEVRKRIPKTAEMVILYAGHAVEHTVILDMIQDIKKYHEVPIVVIENSQAVTSYSLYKAKDELIQAGADFLVYGEPEETVDLLIDSVHHPKKVNGIVYRKNGKTIVTKPSTRIRKLDTLPFPAWDLFPLKNYWNLGYAHAPMKSRYIPLLTSRGCTYNCGFCVIPFINHRKWYARTAENVYKEIIHWKEVYGIKEFHIEDLNPTIDKKRIEQLCSLIIHNGLNITFKFASGIKIETIDVHTLELLHKAGCRYISFSPESGSKHVLSLMKKPFNHTLALTLTKKIHALGIASQACFVIGYPEETQKDREMTKRYIKSLTKAGVDEIALFVMTPVPGSKPYENWKSRNISELTFSPEWRDDYLQLQKYRTKMYLIFFIYKLVYHPLKTLKHPFALLMRKFDIKIEMTLYRLFRTYF